MKHRSFSPPRSTPRVRRPSCVALAAALGLLSAAPAVAGVGDLDPGFGASRTGKVTIPDNSGASVLELPDGRIVVVGGTTWRTFPPKVAINRYLASGAPDPSFGIGGQVLVDLPSIEVRNVSAAALQPDGKIVLAGTYWKDGGLPFVARLDTGGRLDSGFGVGGVSLPGGGTEPHYSSLLVLEDGTIVASISDWTSDRLDHFAADGRYLGNLSDAIAPHRMARQGDGRLVVSGYHRALRRQVVTRLDQRGRVDGSFGEDGFALLPDGYTESLVVEPGADRIVLCGRGVLRLTADGRPDVAFGMEGSGHVAFGAHGVPAFDQCDAILALPGGSIALVGIRALQAVGYYDQMWVAGLAPNGTVDQRFGSGTGAGEIALYPVKGRLPGYGPVPFVGTRGGDALLAKMSSAEYPELQLARVQLASGATSGSGPTVSPPPATTPTPAPAPVATVPPAAAPTPAGGGGGGAAGWLELVLLVTATGAARRFRRCPI